MNRVDKTIPNEKRRRFLSLATGFVAGAGVVGASVPFIGSWQPSAKAKAIGAPVKSMSTKLNQGQW